MTVDAVERARRNRPFLEQRARLRRAVRSFLDNAGFLEVETAVCIPAPAPEEFIETIRAGQRFLRPSPELEMKILMGAGYPKIYQFGPCFRAGEYGRKHREEFTMLEYYQKDADYRILAQLTADFIRHAAETIFGQPRLNYQNESINLAEPYEFLTVKEAFQRYGNTSAEEAMHNDSFDEQMVCLIEPHLGRGHLTFLADYPKERAALARVHAQNPSVAERWELYLCGIELANAYSELTNSAEQRSRFHAAMEVRAANNMQTYPEAKDFLDMIDNGMPECAGSALGFDRLAMIFSNATDIDMVQ